MLKGESDRPKTILVFSGPSGGHLFPAQAFAEAICADQPNLRIVLVTSVRAQKLCEKFPAGLFFQVEYLPEFGFPSGVSPAMVRAAFRIPLAIIRTWKLISRTQPCLCVGFGSFVAYFGVLFSVWRKIPTLIHEQNQIPGKATRMLQNWVKSVAVSFPETGFRKEPNEVFVTGLPIRRDLREEITAMEDRPSQPFTVLVCGGSQGSSFLNGAVLRAFEILSTEERAQFAVIHITGQEQDRRVRDAYRELAVNAEVYPFFEKMRLVYNRAHMAISRAGANSSFEQALYGIPTAFIPYPHAEGHQLDNARFFCERGGALMHEQNENAAAWLCGVLREWVRRPDSYQKAVQAMRKLALHDGHVRLWKIARNKMEKTPCNL